MSFQSPHKLEKNESDNYKNFTLLNYMLLREKGPHKIDRIDMQNIVEDNPNIQNHRHSRINSARFANKRNSRPNNRSNVQKNIISPNKGNFIHKEVINNFCREDFKCLEVLGKGGFGRVMKVV